MKRIDHLSVSMRPMARGLVGSLALAGGLVACGGTQAPTAQRGVSVAVAPLTLPGIGYACYDLLVTNDLEQVVWSQGTSAAEGAAPSVCSNQFGNDEGGAISYVGPCDATDNDTTDAGVAMNTVTLWVDGLYDANTNLDIGEYQNPCPWPTGCSLAFECEENADVLVEFNLTIMRDANQGFFDIAVNFEDIFCSAKVDCLPELLHNDAGERDATVVVGLACSAGENETTHLHVTSLQLTCDQGRAGLLPPFNRVVLPANLATSGQQGPMSEGVFQWANYRGLEALTSDGEPLEKCYWNRAVGLDLDALAGRSCELRGFATASDDGDFPKAGATAYPVISFRVKVLDSETGLCDPNPLNGELSGVQTGYIDAEKASAVFGPGRPDAMTDVACGDSRTCGANDFATSQPDANTLRVSTPGGTLDIPLTGALAGYRLGDGCCLDSAGCCVAP